MQSQINAQEAAIAGNASACVELEDRVDHLETKLTKSMASIDTKFGFMREGNVILGKYSLTNKTFLVQVPVGHSHMKVILMVIHQPSKLAVVNLIPLMA